MEKQTARVFRRSLAAAVALGSVITMGNMAPASAEDTVAGQPAPVAGAATKTMTPIGGGYATDTLEAFARASAIGATGSTVDIVVVPSSYGDAPEDRAENLALAQSRTDQVDAACDAVVPAPYSGCTAVLAPLLARSDATNPAQSAMITQQTDGIYILGGDQGLAMTVLAGTVAESRISAAYRAGANIGGTSAGAAVESVTMGNGYSGDDVYPWDGLQRGSSLVWWGDDGDRERGLAVGSRRAVYDQHFYQRGRFGRLLSIVAESDSRYDGASLLGVGVDYATGVRNTNDVVLSDAFGASSVAVVDMEAPATTTPQWVGPNRLLSVRDVTTHLLTPGPAKFWLGTRTLGWQGSLPGAKAPAGGGAWQGPSAPGARGTIFLGGDLLDGEDTQLDAVVQQVTRVANNPSTALIAVVAADQADAAAAREYAAALTESGWAGRTRVLVRGDAALTPSLQAAGVVFVGESPESVRAGLTDNAFASTVTRLALGTRVVLADRHMAAAFGTWWSPKADPTGRNYEDEAIANFRSGDGQWLPGLRIVDQSVVPSLGYDYRWGKLYDHGQHAPRAIVSGVDMGTAIAVTANPATATVVGAGSVVTLNPRHATWWTAANGAIGAKDARLSVYAPGERITGGQ